MAQQLQNITIGAPGFKGINTQDSPIGLDPQFAEVANNCVIDRFGRLGARKGYRRLTDADQATALGSVAIKQVANWNRIGNNNVIVAVGNNKLFFAEDDSGGSLNHLTELTLPASYTITGDNWTLNDFNGSLYFHQEGHDPLVLTDTSFATGSVVTVESVSNDHPDNKVVLQTNIAMGAFGRMWVSSANKKVLHWSDTLLGADFSINETPDTFAGQIDLTLVWPDGYDEINGLAGHNGKLIIFGKNQIVVYTGAEDPQTMVLEDSFSGTGCESPWTIQSIGNDVLFLSSTGVRSLSRTTTGGDSSLPSSDVSNNIRQDLQTAVVQELANSNGQVTASYSPEEALYLLHFYTSGNIYAFDTRGRLEDGTFRVTTWNASKFNCSHRSSDGKLYVGGTYGIGLHEGYLDDADTYLFDYESAVLTFGNNAALKFLKSIRTTLVGGTNTTATISWGYGFEGSFSSQNININAGANVAVYGISIYNGTAVYSGGAKVTDKKINATGSGRNVRLKVSCEIDGSAFSLQELNVQALLGRIL